MVKKPRASFPVAVKQEQEREQKQEREQEQEREHKQEQERPLASFPRPGPVLPTPQYLGPPHTLPRSFANPWEQEATLDSPGWRGRGQEQGSSYCYLEERGRQLGGQGVYSGWGEDSGARGRGGLVPRPPGGGRSLGGSGGRRGLARAGGGSGWTRATQA